MQNTPSTRIEAYAQLQENLRFYSGLAVWEYTADADSKCNELVRAKIRVGTKDLRIAAIALAVNAVVLTRNTRDFTRVPGLAVQDWTIW